MESKNLIGWQLRRFRIAKGLTVDQLAAALPRSSPLSSEELAQMELGTRIILDYQILAISEILRIPISDLFATPPRKRRAKQEP